MQDEVSWGIEGGMRWLAGSRFLRNAGRYSTSSAASQVLMMIYTIVVARVLGPDQFGKFTGCYALAGLSVFVVNWGMDTWLLREPGSLSSPRSWAGRVLQIKILTGLVWGAGLVFLAPFARPDTFTPLLVFVSALDVWCDGAFTTHLAGLNIQNRFQVISRLLFFSRAARLLGALVLLGTGAGSPLVFAVVRLSATGLGLLAGSFILKPLLSGQGSPSKVAVLRAAVPYGVSEFLTLIYMQADVTMLTILSGSAAAGLYSPSTSITSALFIIPASVFTIAVPELSRQFTSEPYRLPRSILRLSLGFFGLGVALAGAMLLGGGWVVRLFFGPHYLITSVLAGILSPLLLFKSLGFGWAAVLVSVGWQKQRLLPQAISAGLNVLLNLWAIPRLGLPGVAAVYVLSEFILALGYGGLILMWLRTRTSKDNGKGISR